MLHKFHYTTLHCTTLQYLCYNVAGKAKRRAPLMSPRISSTPSPQKMSIGAGLFALYFFLMSLFSSCMYPQRMSEQGCSNKLDDWPLAEPTTTQPALLRPRCDDQLHRVLRCHHPMHAPGVICPLGCHPHCTGDLGTRNLASALHTRGPAIPDKRLQAG